MNYKKYLVIIIAACSICFSACNKVTYRKSPGGMPYRVFPGNDTTKLVPGMILKLGFTQQINDSIYFSNVGKPPFYTPVKEPSPYDISELWSSLKVGDSVITVQAMDTFMKRNPGGLPSHFKKGDKITTYFKVIGVFTSPSEAIEDEKKEGEKYLQKEIAELEQHLKSKKIQAVKTPSGSFVEIISQGTGMPVDSGKFVKVNYTGTSFSGTRFDSNTDTSFHHVEPYGYTAKNGEMILGFDEGVMLLNNGGKGRVYVPSMLAYGPSPNSQLIKPYEILIFDVEVVEVLDTRPLPKQVPGPKTRDTQDPRNK